MKDLIDRQEAIDVVSEGLKHVFVESRDIAEKLIGELPSAQSERKKGKWIIDGHHIRCDQCGMVMCDTDREGDRIPRDFCLNCGADMTEGLRCKND